MEDEIKKLSVELKKLQDVSELEKKTNAQLEIQVSELKEKLSGKNIQKELEENIEIQQLNKKIKDLQAQIEELEKGYKKKMDESKMEQEKLNEILSKERQKVRKLESLSNDSEASKKMIDNLMERVATVEKEKAELAGQYEKYAKISDEVVSYKKRMNEMSSLLEAKEKALEKEKADKASIEHSQEDLLKKMKNLQKENDNLVVKLEGLKTENESLINKNKRLEDRVKVLEDQNKQQLQQLTETLKMPVPLTIDRDTLKSKSEKDIKKIEEIREKSIQAGMNEVERSNTSLNLSLSPPRSMSPPRSPPSLSVPTVNVSDEKRPASSEKSLKVIPKIVEPSTGSTDVSVKTKDKEYTSTINSQVAPTIPRDSPIQGTSKAFADTFSRSSEYEKNLIFEKRHLLSIFLTLTVSKDGASIDDDFDPKTFSIDDQVSDAEGVSELIEDEEDYEYLFNADNF